MVGKTGIMGYSKKINIIKDNKEQEFVESHGQQHPEGTNYK